VPLPGRVSDAAVIFYLHGFASSARSTKAAYLTERLEERGRELRCPDFNQPDFATLTLTRMLDQLRDEIERTREPATLIGSSLGGTVAVLTAEALGPAIDRLVLLAPAVMFAREGHHLLPPERLEQWRRLGELPFFHYGEGAERMLNFAFYEDSIRYNPFDARFNQPTLVFQGRYDASVDPETVEAFARTRPNVTLELLEDDHQLTRSLPRLWDGIAAFLEV
jgi:uncharacterized protein